MKKFCITSLLLTVKNSQVVAILDSQESKTQLINHKSWLTILEIFIDEHSLETAYQRFQQIHDSSLPENLLNQCLQACHSSSNFYIMLANKKLKFLQQKWLNFRETDQDIDLLAISEETSQVLLSLFNEQFLTTESSNINSFDDFSQTVKYLLELGLLSPAVNNVEWGDLKRRFPVCSNFGFTRGTPIDRYYLNQFISEIRHQVVGSVLEIGGIISNKELFQFTHTIEYQTLDLVFRPGVTIVGDVHDSTIIKPETLDTILIFNVLEHCHNPWVAVQNIYSWLRVGGKCICMVPSAQRLHCFPHDYWRPLPEGMKQLFKDFSELNLYIYGNPLTVLASFMGVVAEELSPQDLDDFHPDYPVATCITALK